MSAQPIHEGTMLEVDVDGIDDEARGRAVSGGMDIAVRGALPGDRVRCRVERVFAARGLAQARGLDVVRRSPLHVERTCEHAAPCPGCPLHGVDEGFVRALKKGRVEQALADVGLLAHVDDVVESRAPRQKVKLTAGGRAGAIRLGLFVPHSHLLVGAEACPHQDAAISDALDVLGPALDATGLPPATAQPSGIKAVIARVFREGVGVVVVVGAPLEGEAFRLLGACVDGDPIVSLAVRVDERAGNSLVGGDVQRFVGPRALTPLEGPAEGAVPETVDAFCQTDPELAAWLYATCAAFLVEGRDKNARYADLYAGTGGFSRALLAAGAERITAVERAPASAASLASLAVEGLEMSVEEALPVLADRGPFSGIVVDPPKSGLKEAAVPLARLHASRVALVACDPDAGARDAKAFVDEGYTIERVVPVDLFPATPEVETVIFMRRQSPRP